MRRRCAPLAVLFLVLAGCVAPSQQGPGPDGDTQANGTASRAPGEGADPEVFLRATGPKPWEALEATPLLAWQADPCDPNAQEGASGNAPLPAPFDGSVADLVHAIEAAFDVAFTEVRARPQQVIAYVQTGPTSYSHVVSVDRAAGPNLDLDADFPWPALGAGAAWAAVNATVARLGAPPADRASLIEQVGQLRGELAWTGESPFGVAALQALDADPYHQSDFRLAPRPLTGPLPSQAASNASLDEGALAFAACRFGGEHVVSGDPTLEVRAASVARKVYVVRPAEAGCYGAGHHLVQDVVTKAILGSWKATQHHLCQGSGSTVTSASTSTSASTPSG